MKHCANEKPSMKDAKTAEFQPFLRDGVKEEGAIQITFGRRENDL